MEDIPSELTVKPYWYLRSNCQDLDIDIAWEMIQNGLNCATVVVSMKDRLHETVLFLVERLHFQLPLYPRCVRIEAFTIQKRHPEAVAF